MTIPILPGELSPNIDSLYWGTVQELSEDPQLPSVQDLLAMFKICPVNRICCELKSLRGVAGFGTYAHPDSRPVLIPSGRTTLTEWVNSNFQTMTGNLEDAIGKMFRQAYGIGYSVGEIINSSNISGHQGEWRLSKIKILNPCRYSFAGREGEWDRIIYKSHQKSQYPIPREKLIHIYIPSLEEPENPLGDPQGARAYTFYKARMTALRSWNKQIIRNSKGLTILKGKSDDTVTVKDEEGNTVYKPDGTAKTKPALKDAVEKFVLAEDGDVVAIDKTTEHFHIPGVGGLGADYNLALTRYTDDIMLAYGIPKTILQEGSATLGQAGLNYGHRLIFDTQIEGLVVQMRNQIIEQIVRPLLQANFGIQEQDEFGGFTSEKFLPPEMSATRVSNIMSAMLQGVLDTTDIEGVNVIRRDCGLEPLTKEEFDRRQVQKLLQQQQQQSYMAEGEEEG